MEKHVSKEELIALITKEFKDIRLGALVDLIGEPLSHSDKPPFHVNVQPKQGNIYIGCVAQKKIIEPAAIKYFENRKLNAMQEVKLMQCMSGKWVGESAGIDYIKLFNKEGPLQFAGFGNYWESKPGYSWAIFGYMNKKPKKFTLLKPA